MSYRCGAAGLDCGGLGRYEIIFIDDSSTDGTLDAIRALVAGDRKDPLPVVRAELRPSGGATRRSAARARACGDPNGFAISSIRQK
jgi:glycosyltransferase involved in cell wall biosynthesis